MLPSNSSIEEILKNMLPSRELDLLERRLQEQEDTEAENDFEDKLYKLQDDYEELDSNNDDKFDLLVLINDECKKRSGTRKDLVSTILTYIEDSGIEV